MNIFELELFNFRNQIKKRIEFSDKITIIIGKNASGKTNLIEAVFFLAIARSFRLGSDVQAIRFGSEMARIKGKIAMSGENKLLEVVLTTGEVTGIKTPIKKLTVNEIARRGIDFTGILKCVLFWPEHMELVTDSPSLRRHYLDSVLLQVDREYRRTHLSYERGLRQRNKLLLAIRDSQAHQHQLLFWDQLLIKQGSYLTGKREEFIEFANNFSLDKLKSVGVSYQLFYDKSIISVPRLEQYKDAEMAAGVTLVGPHRDDMKFKIKSNKNAFLELSNFGRTGEQRLAVLGLKLV